MTTDLSPLFSGLCDDAAVFPPGNLPLKEAVPAHLRHRAGAHAGTVGAFVVAAKDLDELCRLVEGQEPSSFGVTVTVPLPRVAEVLSAVDATPVLRLAALEVAVPGAISAGEVVPTLERALAGRSVPVFVEMPRDERRPAIVAALSGTRFMAKLRTGGVSSDLYPDERELAGAIRALTAAEVPFKATAGLHHALRNTDPDTGFEQHGFLNLLAATGAALAGAEEPELAAVLAERDGVQVVELVRALPFRVREAFRSFGTCSITEPVEELADLGLVPARLRKDLA